MSFSLLINVTNRLSPVVTYHHLQSVLHTARQALDKYVDIVPETNEL